jgi:ABC-type antimicrobial peptide transport system permease subunit
LLLACVVVTVLLTTGLAAVGWTFAVTVIPPGAQSTLAAPQSRVIKLSGVVDAGQAAADSQLIRTTLGKAWPEVGFQMDSALWAQPIQLPQPATAASTCSSSSPLTQSRSPGCSGTTTTTQVELASLEGLRAQTTLTAGTWPGPPRHGGALPVALPAAAAARLHLTVGSVLRGTPESATTPVSLLVTGLFRPKNPASSYWGLDLLPSSGISVRSGTVSAAGISEPLSSVSYGPAVVNPAAFGGTLPVSQASWMVLPQAPALARGNIGAFAASTSAAVSQLSVILPEGLTVTSGLPQLLAGIASSIVLARSLFAIGALELLLVAGVALALAARLLASLREEESALLRARGATRWQLARPALAEAVVLGAVAGLAGVLAGTRVTGVLAGLGGLHLEGYSGFPPLAWLSALATLVLCAAVMAWPALHAPAPGEARRRRGRQARLAGIAWAGGDLALVALAAIAVWELRGYSAVARPATGSLGIDPAVAVAPALALAGVAIIPLRGLPLLARLADKATDYERRLAAAMASWQIARRPIRQAGPVLLVAIATATATLALAGYASWQQSAADQSAFAVGSDVRVDSATALPLGAAGSVTRAPGVTAATPAALASIGNGSQLIALDASTAANTILLRPDLSPLPLSALWRGIIPSRRAGLALPGRPGRLEILAALGVRPADLGPVTVQAWIQDANGATDEIPAAGSMPSDGKPHSLVFPLAGGRQASYPLRLLGLTLTYALPPFDPKNPTSVPGATLSVQSLAVAGTASGPFGGPFSGGAALAAWQGEASATLVPTGPADPFGGTPPADGAPPVFLGGPRAGGGTQRFPFSTGYEPSPQVMSQVGLSPGSARGQVTIAARPQSLVVPAIATTGYLTASRLRVGSTAMVTLGGYPVTVAIVASVARFPAVFGRSGALIADLTQVNDALVASQASPVPTTVPVTRWWLRTTGGEVPRLPAGLGLSVTDRASQQAVLLGNPLLRAPRQAMLAVGLAALLLGVLGFSISVAASLRSRRTQSAVFAALGVGRRAQAGQLCLEQCALSVPAAVAGLLAGIGLAELIVPPLTLTAGAADPVPVPLTVVPLGLAAALALVTAAMPVAAAALTVARRPDPAVRLRAEAV